MRSDRIKQTLVGRVLWLVLMVVAISLNALGQTAARPDRGTRPTGSYSSSDIDNISLTNGNVNVTVPLASLPPMAGGRLSWVINAQYNSKLWDVKRTEVKVPLGPTYVVDSLQLGDTGGWRIGSTYTILEHDAREDFDWAQADPNDPDAAALSQSWRKIVLTTPDGAEHELRPMDYASFSGLRDHLRGYYRETPDTQNAAMRYYSFDGSFIWAKRYPTGSSVRWEVFLPDGTQIVQRNNGLQKIRDTNGNVITIGSGVDAQGNVYTYYRDDMGTDNPPNFALREIRLSRTGNSGYVEYRKVGGEWVRINLSWGFTTIGGNTYPIQDHNSSNQVCNRRREMDAASPDVLRTITLPVTEPGQSTGRQFVFSYNSDGPFETVSLPVQGACGSNISFVTSASKGFGSLSQINMPSGETIQYTYQQDTPPGNGRHELFAADDASAESITLKRVIHDGVTDDWNYSIASNFGGSVTAPDGSSAGEVCYSHSRSTPGYYGGASGFGGLVYRSNQSNTTMIEKHWASLSFNGASIQSPGGLVVFNPVVDVEYTTLLNPSNGAKLKMSAKKFKYDFNGNLIQQIDYDWFDPNLVSRDGDGVPIEVPASATVLRVLDNTFYNQAPTELIADQTWFPSYFNVYARRLLADATPLILNALETTATSDAALTQLSRSRFAYDLAGYGVPPSKANLTAESRRLMDGGGSWIESTHTYDSYGNRLTTTAPSGSGLNTTTWVYDTNSHAQATQVTVNPQNGSGTQTSLTVYDYWTGLPTSQTDVNGNVATTSYINQRLNIIDPYNRAGLVTSPAVTSYVDGTTSNNQQHKVISKYYDNATTNNAFQVEVISDLKLSGDGLLRSRTTYDQMGRVVLSESSEDGSSYTISSQTVYQQMGRITLTSNPRRSASALTDGWTRTTLDNARRVSEVASFATNALPPSSGTNTNFTGKVMTTYNANSTTVVDQAGKQRRSLTDALGRLVRVDEPDSSSPTGNLGTETSPLQATSYSYDALGNLTGVTQGLQTRFFRYDSLSRLVRAKNPEQQINGSLTLSDGSQWSMGYAYDTASNLTLRTNPNATTVSFTYDGLNRAKTKTLSTGSLTWNYNYDAGAGVTNPKGRLISVIKNGTNEGTYYDGFDAGGRLQSSRQITRVGGQDFTYTTSYAYDLADNLTKEVYPSGKEFRTSFDNAGRVAGVKNQTANLYYAGAVSSDSTNRLQYTAHGAASIIKLGNGRWEHTNFNSRLQPTRIGLGNSGSDASVLRLDYTYNTSGQADNNGNVLSQTISAPKPDNTTAVFIQSYTYDSLNRLKSAGETGTWNQIYDHDRYGNRAVRSGSSMPAPSLTPTSTVGGDLSAAISTTTNRLLVSGYNFDASGNMTSDPTTSLNAIVYDSENRQTSYIKAGVTNSYEYDGDGRRVKKSDGTQTTVFVYDGMGKLVAEYRNDPVPTPQVGGGTSYLTTDGLGSTRVVTGAGGQVKSRRDYLPYGEEVSSAIPWGVRSTIAGYAANDGQEIKFTGQRRDAESGYDYFMARYYSGAQGRFTSPDEFAGGPDEFWMLGSGDSEKQALPFAETANPQSINKYQYCFNNPLRYVDPDGHQTGTAGQQDEPKQSPGLIIPAPTVVKAVAAIISFFLPKPPPPPPAPEPPAATPEPKKEEPQVQYKAGVPPASSKLKQVLDCTQNCSGEQLVVTSTDEKIPQHKEGTPHRRGEAADVRVRRGQEQKVIDCAGNCGAQFALNERKRPSKRATGPHVHIQLVPGPGGSRGDLPPKKR